MSDIAIRVENLSKAYQLGDFGTGTLSRDIERWWALARGKDDPFLMVGETNDRTSKGGSDVVWSLKDINFDIKEGDAVGIIGRNGAGKSTLLKVLSRVTSPSTGKIKVKGRIASLLEVGTGFHPELTGGENIYLNGAIMGMSKREIKKKFDEIVDFAGVDRYVDTPVKRYSSGMYVRLAFAVAAHLESEILIVDEVLAVGDAEFQKKCLGKMNDVSKGEGRTVLFVSHNMGSVRSLCNNAILLDKGRVILTDTADNVINFYNSKSTELKDEDLLVESKCKRFTMEKPYWTDMQGNRTAVYTVGEPMILCFNFNFKVPVTKVNPGFAVSDFQDQRIFTSHLADDENFNFSGPLLGNVILKTVVDLPLSPSTYKVVYGVRDEFENTVIYNENVVLVVEESVSKNGAEGILWHTTQWSLEK